MAAGARGQCSSRGPFCAKACGLLSGGAGGAAGAAGSGGTAGAAGSGGNTMQCPTAVYKTLVVMGDSISDVGGSGGPDDQKPFYRTLLVNNDDSLYPATSIRARAS